MLPSEDLVYSYVMEKNGKEYVFGIYPEDQSYTFKELKLLNPEAQPKITDYSVWDDEKDFTAESLKGNKLMIIIHDVSKIDKSIIPKIVKLEKLVSFWIEVIIVTSSGPNSVNKFKDDYNLDIKTTFADATVLKTIVRSNPGFFLLRHGIVKGKWHYNKFPNPEELLRKVDIKI